eukprot:4675045-Lingulodinium_polyedra.AAC.1
MGYRAIPRGAWEPTSRDEVPDFGLFRTESSIDRGYLEFARAFRVLFPDFADHFRGALSRQGRRTRPADRSWPGLLPPGVGARL